MKPIDVHRFPLCLQAAAWREEQQQKLQEFIRERDEARQRESDERKAAWAKRARVGAVQPTGTRVQRLQQEKRRRLEEEAIAREDTRRAAAGLVPVAIEQAIRAGHALTSEQIEEIHQSRDAELKAKGMLSSMLISMLISVLISVLISMLISSLPPVQSYTFHHKITAVLLCHMRVTQGTCHGASSRLLSEGTRCFRQIWRSFDAFGLRR